MTLADGDLNNYFNNKESVDALEDFNHTLPYKLKDASLSEVQDELDKASKQITEQAKKIQNNAIFKTIDGVPIAPPKSKNPGLIQPK